MIKGVLFDKDGTLLGFHKAWHGILTEVFLRFESDLGIEPSTIERLKLAAGYQRDGFAPASVVRYLSISELIDRWFEGCHELDRTRLREPMRGVFEQSAVGSDLAVKVLPGARETLDVLSTRGYPLGVATADMPHSTCAGLERTGLLEYFSFIGSDDGQHRPKPHPEMAHRFCSESGIRPEELLVVGDSAIDLEFAHNAKASFAGIATAYNDFEPPGTDGAAFVPHLGELIPRFGL